MAAAHSAQSDIPLPCSRLEASHSHSQTLQSAQQIRHSLEEDVRADCNRERGRESNNNVKESYSGGGNDAYQNRLRPYRIVAARIATLKMPSLL